MLKSPTPPFAYFNKSRSRFSLPSHPRVYHAIPLSCHGWLNLYLIRRPAHLPRGYPTLYSFPSVVSLHTTAPVLNLIFSGGPILRQCVFMCKCLKVFAAEKSSWQCGRYVTVFLANVPDDPVVILSCCIYSLSELCLISIFGRNKLSWKKFFPACCCVGIVSSEAWQNCVV